MTARLLIEPEAEAELEQAADTKKAFLGLGGSFLRRCGYEHTMSWMLLIAFRRSEGSKESSAHMLFADFRIW